MSADRIAEALRGSAIFAGIGRVGMARVVRACSLQRLPGGEVLYEQGTSPDGLYLVAHGRMRAERRDEHGVVHVLRELRAGDTMGGLSLMAGKPHRATLRAMRDTEVVCIGEAAVERLLYRHPNFGREAVRQWLRAVLYTPPPRTGDERRSARTLAVVPAHEGAPVEVVADALLTSLRDRGSVVRSDGQCIDGPDTLRQCDRDLSDDESVPLLDGLERDYRFVVYMARHTDDAWCARSLRQADRIIVVAASGMAASSTPIWRALMAMCDRRSTGEAVMTATTPGGMSSKPPSFADNTTSGASE